MKLYEPKFVQALHATAKNVMSIFCVIFFYDIKFFYYRDIRAAVRAKSSLICFHNIFEGIFVLSYRRGIFLHHFTAKWP